MIPVDGYAPSGCTNPGIESTAGELRRLYQISESPTDSNLLAFAREPETWPSHSIGGTLPSQEGSRVAL
jgi:hypothetical protein